MNPSPMDRSVHARLRRATHDQHVQLNHHPMLNGLVQPSFSLPIYRLLLIAYFHLYQALEQKITDYLVQQPCLFDYKPRQKLPWLAQDIEFFQDHASASETPPPCLSALPSIENTGSLVGLLYVIEGSTLGGQHIFGKLSKFQSLSREEGARFFYGYGEQTAEKWENFLQFSDSIHERPLDCAAAEASAICTFRLFESVLNDYMHRDNYLKSKDSGGTHFSMRNNL